MVMMYGILSHQVLAVLTSIPSSTGHPPTMTILDKEHVLVDYSQSFDIPDFSKIRTASILIEGYNYLIAGKSDFEHAFKKANRVYQHLVENEPLKAKLNPCESRYFQVQLTFGEPPTMVNSIGKDYKPGLMQQVSKSFIFILSNLHEFSGGSVQYVFYQELPLCPHTAVERCQSLACCLCVGIVCRQKTTSGRIQQIGRYWRIISTKYHKELH